MAWHRRLFSVPNPRHRRRLCQPKATLYEMIYPSQRVSHFQISSSFLPPASLRRVYHLSSILRGVRPDPRYTEIWSTFVVSVRRLDECVSCHTRCSPIGPRREFSFDRVAATCVKCRSATSADLSFGLWLSSITEM